LHTTPACTSTDSPFSDEALLTSKLHSKREEAGLLALTSPITCYTLRISIS